MVLFLLCIFSPFFWLHPLYLMSFLPFCKVIPAFFRKFVG